MKQNNKNLATKLKNRLQSLMDTSFNCGDYEEAKYYKSLIEQLEIMVEIIKTNAKLKDK